MANVLPNSPAAGHAQIKTGNRVVGNPAGQIMVLGNSLAGYIHTRSGRRVTVMIAVGNVPLEQSRRVPRGRQRSGEDDRRDPGRPVSRPALGACGANDKPLVPVHFRRAAIVSVAGAGRSPRRVPVDRF